MSYARFGCAGRSTLMPTERATKSAICNPVEFDAAEAVLEDQMDALAPQFKAANATFVSEYQNARILVDSTGGGKKPEPPPQPLKP